MRNSGKVGVSISVSVLALFSAFSAPSTSVADDPSRDVDKLMIIDCMLPGKVMRLGAGARYMSARRPIKTTGADCEIRGGEYVAYDRASYASSLNVWLPEAKGGDPKAQTYVGEMFEQGLGTTPDYATAVAWYRKAAEQGYERAQMNLGSMYERGLGVEKNELEALNWYRKATGMGADELVSSDEYSALEAEAAGLREALEASEAEIARLKNDLSSSQQRLNESQGRLDRTQFDLEAMRYEASRATAMGGDSADVAALYQEIRQKEQALAANRKELAEIRVAFDRQQAQFAEQLSAQEDNQAATQALLDLQRDKLRSLETQVAQLTTSLERRQAELRQSNQELLALRQQLETRAADASDAGTVAELLAVIARQQAELEKKAHTTSFLEQELANQKQLLEAERLAFQQREQRLLADADIMQVELQDVQRRLDQTEVLLSSYQQRMVENDRLIQRREAEIVQQQAEIRQLRAAGEPSKSTEIRALEAGLGERTIDLAGTQGEQAALIATVNNLEVELDRLRSQLTQTNQLASTTTRGIDPLPAARPRPSLPEVEFGEYHALIIGNNDYPELPKLETPVNDALAVARILEDKYGFKTQVLINADRYTILQTLNSFKEKLSANDNFLLYYAGHGTLDEKNNRGHWLPVDAHPTIPTNWISNVTITEYINTFEAKHVMVIADSCYSGTLTRQVRPALARGKAKARESEYYQKWAKIPSRTALTSGGLQPVLDRGGGAHSIFAGSLLESLKTNNGVLPGPDLFYEVYQRVNASGLNVVGQTPTFDVIDRTGDLGAPFFFVPG
jgi:hypothetical protein